MARSVIVRVFIACSIRAHTGYHRAGKLEEFTIFEHLVKKVWSINRSAKRLIIASADLDGFS